MDSTLVALGESIARFAEREIAPSSQEVDTNDALRQVWVTQLADMGCFSIGKPEPDGMGIAGECTVLRELARASGSLAVDVAQRMLSVRAMDAMAGDDAVALAHSLREGAALTGISRGFHAGGTALVRAFGAMSPALVVLLPPYERIGDAVRIVTAPTCSARTGLDGLRGLAAFDADAQAGTALDEKTSPSLIAADRILLAAVATGLGRGALDLGIAYAKQRTQFGKPIAAYGEMQALLAKALARHSSAEAVVINAAREFDEGRHDIEMAALAFTHASHASVRVAERAQHVHGGYGHMHEYLIGRYVRDARTLRSLGGATPIVDKFLAQRMGLVENKQAQFATTP